MSSAIAEAPTMTSEQASRYLRSKTEDIGPLIDFAHGLIDARYKNVYFPRKEEFLMDWWFDRAEIGMKNGDYWKIFKTIWTSLDTDSQRQIYHRHKFLDTIKSTLGWIASEVAANDDPHKEILAILSSVFNAVECVEQANIWLRCTTEVMMSIVIDYLKIVSVIPDAAMESWYRLIFIIYENALYGVSNFKKISQSFSSRGLLASFTVLKAVDSQTKLHEKLSNILRDLVFSPSVIKDNENQPFKNLCDALSQIPGIKQDGVFLGHVLSLGLSKFGKTKQQALMPKMCEEFLNFAPQTAQYILCQAKDHDITISSEMLTKALLMRQPIDWNLATMVLDVDADAVFPLVEGLLDDQLRNSDKSPEIVCFVCHIAEAYTKIRNLPRFINIWRKTLAGGVPETSVLASEELVRAVATQISGNWTIHQLHSIFMEIIPRDEDDLIEGDLLPLIAITIGASLLQDPLPDSLLLKAQRLYSLLDSEPLQGNYLMWRLKYLILSMHKTIVKSVIKSLYTEASDIASAVKSLVNPDKRVKDRRISYFKFQMLFRLAEFRSWTGFSPVAQWLLDIMDRKSYSSWDQDIAHIGKENLSTALAHCIVNRWLVLVEHRFEIAQIKKLVTSLWNMAMHSDELFTDVWKRLITSPVAFEQVKIKDCIALQLQSQFEIQQFDHRTETIDILKAPTASTLSTEQEESMRKVITSLLAYPIEALRRSRRERILDYLLLVDASSSRSLSLECRRLIRKLLMVPSMTAILQSNPAGLEYLVNRLNSTQDKLLESITVDIVNQVFKHSSSGDSQDKRALLDELNGISYNAIMQTLEKLNIGYVKLFSISSTYLEKIGGLDELPRRLMAVKGKIFGYISTVNKDDFVMMRSLVLSLSEIYSLLDSKSRGTLPMTVLSHVSFGISFVNSNAHDTFNSEICGEIVQGIFELFLLSSPHKEHDELSRAQYIVSYFVALHDLSTRVATVDCKMIRKLFQENAKSWSASIYAEIVDELIHISFPATDYSRGRYIEALACLITLDGSEHYAFLVKKMSLISCSLVLGLGKITSSKLFLEILHMFESVLKEQPSLVSPLVFEQMSIFLILSTSRSGPSFIDEYDIDNLYISLCSVTSTILLSFSKFLRGHHNLVIRLLQNLLYPLCVPRPVGSSRRIEKSIQNHWKRAAWLSNTSACSASCALAYSRLISNLCEPPTRSWKDSRKRILADSHGTSSFSLSSAAGVSRRALSKHAPYLLVEYCYANLNYNFDPDTRQALTQGIYTLFDSLGQNELKIANAALDVGARAIFKTAYDDYLKFGKWHEI